MKRRVLVSLFMVMFVGGAAAQQQSDLMAEAQQAFREGAYYQAARTFERLIEQEPDNAEAHYLLARLYYETPLRDDDKANDALEKAIELDPDNVRYLVAQLQQLRDESWNFFAERFKGAKRVELARDILELDPDNAFAHEELGTAYIRDFWRYRNAIQFPTLSFYNQQYETEDATFSGGESDEGDIGDGSGGTDFAGSVLDLPEMQGMDPNQVFMQDQFDVEALKRQGVPVQDLSGRAQRAYEKAIDHLEHALETDPRRRSVYDHMMEIFSLKGEYQAALDMLQQMYRFFPEDPELWTYLGLSHYYTGNLEAADRSFETAFRYMDPKVERAYTDLEYILPGDEKKRYEEDPVAYASRFWVSKDPRYLTQYNERKLEHYARLTYADLLYGSSDLDLRGWETQRGRILVRYGLPHSDVVIIPNTGGELAESRGVRDFSVGATLTGDQQGQQSGGSSRNREQVVEEMVGVSQTMFNQMNTFNVWDYGDFQFVFEDPFRNGEYRLYSPPADEMGPGTNAWMNDYAIKAEETFRKVPERYEYEAPGRQIELPYLVTTFKGEEGQTDLYVHYGVPINEYDPNQETIELTVNTGTFLISDQRDILVERRRTLYGLQTEQIVSFEESNLWVDTQRMEAPPGEHEVSVEFETASKATVAVQRRAVEVPDFSADRLALSDLMLAYHVEDTPDGTALSKSEIVRNGLSIQPAPWSVFNHAQPIYLYFEVYDLARNDNGQTDYDVEILLAPKDDAGGVRKFFNNLFGGEEGVSIQYPGSGTRPDESQYQILDAQDEEPGLYTLVVRVRDNVAGESVESEQDLFLE